MYGALLGLACVGAVLSWPGASGDNAFIGLLFVGVWAGVVGGVLALAALARLARASRRVPRRGWGRTLAAGMLPGTAVALVLALRGPGAWREPPYGSELLALMAAGAAVALVAARRSTRLHEHEKEAAALGG